MLPSVEFYLLTILKLPAGAPWAVLYVDRVQVVPSVVLAAVEQY